MQDATVYLDMLFLTNFAVNFLILFAINEALQIEPCYFRLFLASFIGALYGCLMFFPKLSLVYNVFFKIAFSVIIAGLSCKFKNFRLFFRYVISFYVLAFLFSGCMIFIDYFFEVARIQNDVVYFNNNATWVFIVSLFSSYFGINLFLKYIVNNQRGDHVLFSVTVCIKNKFAELKALVDTGCSIKDPLYSNGIVIAEYDVLKKIIPESILMQMENSLTTVSSDVLNIPYKSLDSQVRTLPAIKSDYVKIIGRKNSIRYRRNIFIALIRNKKLSSDGTYNALLSQLL